MVASADWSIVDLLVASPPLPSTWRGVYAVSHMHDSTVGWGLGGALQSYERGGGRVARTARS